MTKTVRDWSKAKRQRQRVFPIRLTDAEHAELIARAESAGLTVAALIRLRCLEQKPPRSARRPSVDVVAVAQLLGQLGKVGGNVNQIARTLNAGGAPVSMILSQAEAVADIAEMRAALMKALGLAPD